MKSKFIEWEGDVYRIDDIPTGFAAFKFIDGAWVEVDGRLIATIEFEGIRVANPSTKNNIQVIFENQDLAVLDKPAGLTVHKTNVNDTQYTLVDFITKKWPETKALNWPDPIRAGIVHRLDKDTSGLIVIAKNPETQKYLQKQFKTHKVKKIYTLLCFGKTDKEGTVKTLTTRDDKLHNKQKMSLLSFSWQKGKAREAITAYKTIKNYNFDGQALSLVEAQILTGRTHQIRNHFKFIGHPLIGDDMYFTKESKSLSDQLDIHRQFLHSSTIAFNLPNGKLKSITSQTPEDLKQIILRLKE